MNENPFLKAKRERIDQEIKIIKSYGQDGTTVSRAVAVFQYNSGISEKTARQDINLLVNLDTVKRIGPKLIINTPLSLSQSVDNKPDMNNNPSLTLSNNGVMREIEWEAKYTDTKKILKRQREGEVHEGIK